MYFFILLAAAEDAPFVVLKSLYATNPPYITVTGIIPCRLLSIPMRNSISELSPQCDTWMRSTQAVGTLMFLLISVSALAYKMTHLTLFPVIWAQHKRLEKEITELDKKEAAFFKAMQRVRLFAHACLCFSDMCVCVRIEYADAKKCVVPSPFKRGLAGDTQHRNQRSSCQIACRAPISRERHCCRDRFDQFA